MNNNLSSEYSALRKTTSVGSKLMVTATTLSISAFLGCIFFSRGYELNNGYLPGLSVQIPAPYTIPIIALSSVIIAWVGWSYLNQAQRLMWRLEFELNAPEKEIRAALTGSSLISANVLFFRFMCGIAFIPLITLLMLVFKYFSIWAPIAFIMSLLICFPFWTLCFFLFSYRLTYLNPDKWNTGSFYNLLIESTSPGELISQWRMRLAAEIPEFQADKLLIEVDKMLKFEVINVWRKGDRRFGLLSGMCMALIDNNKMKIQYNTIANDVLNAKIANIIDKYLSKNQDNAYEKVKEIIKVNFNYFK